METADASTRSAMMPRQYIHPLEHSFERPLVLSQRVIVHEPSRRIRDRVRRAVVNTQTEDL